MTGFSSLPLAQEEGDPGASSRKFKGTPRILGPRWASLPTITVGLLGVQIFWSVEMSYASPYLLSLGLSKSRMAVVFLAGPLSGLIMQPLIGVLADNSTSRFGRRRPYMLIGTMLCMCGMLLLGFTRPFATLFTTLGSRANDVLTIWLAVLSIFFIDFAINAVQAMDRALLVDTLSPSRQAAGNAWAARMLGVGSVVGFFVGNVNLTKTFPFFGKTQLQVLSVIVSIFLLVGHIVMAICVKERVLLKQNNLSNIETKKQNAFVKEVKDLWSNIRTLPWVIQQICFIQFCAWIAWFPVLFYSTIYVGDFHKFAGPLPTTDAEKAALDQESTRLGSRALFYSSVIALIINIALPAFIVKPTQEGAASRIGIAPSSKLSWLKVPRVLQFHLASLWAFSLLVFALSMFATFFVRSLLGATLLISVTGFSWAVTQWAPFALLAEAILTEPGAPAADDTGSIQLTDARTRPRVDHDESSDSESEDEVSKAIENRRLLLGNPAAHVSRIRIDVDDHLDSGPNDNDYEIVNGNDRDGTGPNPSGSLSAKAGIILGIHNVFIVIPQFLVTGLSSIIFAIFDPHTPPTSTGQLASDRLKNATSALVDSAGRLPRDVYYLGNELISRAETVLQPTHSNSVVYIFRIGGVAATFGFVLCWRLARNMKHR
ncbi:sucrose transporter [Coprinopsis marcescibilis]|uniref:Sucrose transporter n=1 Tax=Coprinopsis marcescibilis TaxID=230819 RepID=A0A5C3KLG0_COPMA|nr:sucrose transporter [Coprinopsis marcescibilis]